MVSDEKIPPNFAGSAGRASDVAHLCLGIEANTFEQYRRAEQACVF